MCEGECEGEGEGVIDCMVKSGLMCGCLALFGSPSVLGDKNRFVK